MKKISVTKYDGTREAYSQEKLVHSILRSGVKHDEVIPLLTKIESRLYEGIPTSEIYQMVHGTINEAGFQQSSRFYRIREAMAKMGSIQFEQFVAKILDKEGFSCQWNVIVPGFCIEHQIDVIAKNENGESFYIEVKHHRNPHRLCGLGIVAEIWARLEDLKHGYETGKNKYDFTSAWLICNTKFSDHAKQYSTCKNLMLTGWQYAFDTKGQRINEGLEARLDLLDRDEVDKLLQKVIV